MPRNTISAWSVGVPASARHLVKDSMSSQDQKLLTRYPHLHRYLVADGEALSQFNLLCTDLRGRVKLQDAEINSTRDFLMRIGEMVEQQTGLTPHDVQELEEGPSVAPVYLTPRNLRTLLECYWGWRVEELENKIRRKRDPALESRQLVGEWADEVARKPK